jgi:hypothetical protein
VKEDESTPREIAKKPASGLFGKKKVRAAIEPSVEQ